MLRVGIIAAIVLPLVTTLTVAPGGAEEQRAPAIKVVPLDPGDRRYLLLLAGPPETTSFRSGLVTLAPGQAIGVHDSGVNEEMLVPLEGEGELRFAEHPPVTIRPGLVTYAPAHTRHDVVNTGTARLRYIFITARTE